MRGLPPSVSSGSGGKSGSTISHSSSPTSFFAILLAYLLPPFFCALLLEYQILQRFCKHWNSSEVC